MPAKFERNFSAKDFKSELEEHGSDPGKLSGWMFEDLLLYTDLKLTNEVSFTDNCPDFRTKQAFNTARFAGARLTNDLKEGVTHVLTRQDRSTTRVLRKKSSE